MFSSKNIKLRLKYWDQIEIKKVGDQLDIC